MSKQEISSEIDIFYNDLNQLQNDLYQEKNHPFLTKHVNKFLTKRVLIPFCGKSPEIAWFASKGFEVVGIENREENCENFFNLQNLECLKSEVKNFQLFASKDGKIKIYNGDIFNFTNEYEETFDCIWDRMTFWTFTEEKKTRYVEHLKKIMSPNIRYLLHTFDSELPSLKGPPFGCKLNDLQNIFGDDYAILLIESSKPVKVEFLKKSVIVQENFYLVKKFMKNRCNFYAF
ncbi:thiopurine S-methyltransferase [Brachionus plicatilis]|uniref:Thiopurine S-methyltransferase n=1 Tax=Brachionus plicatilis TaxID=10195 RepID=A0A3M7R8C9_BRAPC|nr:thiopurine S-methyltransferase [Brachionus plicatilis]